MTEQRSYRELLEMLEAALADVGCFLTATDLVEMVKLLDRIDRVEMGSQVELLCAELAAELRTEVVPASCNPSVWLSAVECA